MIYNLFRGLFDTRKSSRSPKSRKIAASNVFKTDHLATRYAKSPSDSTKKRKVLRLSAFHFNLD